MYHWMQSVLEKFIKLSRCTNRSSIQIKTDDDRYTAKLSAWCPKSSYGELTLELKDKQTLRVTCRSPIVKISRTQKFYSFEKSIVEKESYLIQKMLSELEHVIDFLLHPCCKVAASILDWGSTVKSWYSNKSNRITQCHECKTVLPLPHRQSYGLWFSNFGRFAKLTGY